jgi:hypothetical protein
MTRLLPVLILCFAVPATAEELAKKLFAGVFESAEQLQASLRGQPTITLSETTVIPCDVGIQFGVAYMLRITRREQRAADVHSFVETWQHPPVEGQDSTSRDIAARFKKRQSNPKFSGWQLTAGTMVDGDVTLTISREGQEYLRHVFQVMGCAPESRTALEEAMSRSDSADLVCAQEKQVGTRVKKTVCKTRKQMEAEEESARRELSRSQNGVRARSGGGTN